MARPFAKRLTMSAKSIAAVMILMSAAGCVSDIRGARQRTILNSLCALYPDADHPPVLIEASDSQAAIDEKIDFLIAWEVECRIKP